MGSKHPPPGLGRGLVALAILLLVLPAGAKGAVFSPGFAPHPCASGDALPGDTLDSRLDLNGLEEADFEWAIRPLGGELTTLEAFRGQVLFINMWATWCGPCVEELSGIETLLRSFPAETEDIVFLLVSPEEPEVVERFLRARGYDLPAYLEIQEIPEAFGLEALPTTWIVDRGGKIVLKHRGAAEWNQPEVRAFLMDLQGR